MTTKTLSSAEAAREVLEIFERAEARKKSVNKPVEPVVAPPMVVADPITALLGEDEIPEGFKYFGEVFGFSPVGGIPEHLVRVFPEGGDFVPPAKRFTDYIPNREVLSELSFLITTGGNISLVGPTGSGKTSIQEFFCMKTNRNYYRINGRGDMESESILGKPWVESGSMRWVKSDFINAWEQGFFITIDEWSKIPSFIMMSLQRGLEIAADGREIYIEGIPSSRMEDKVFKMHPDTVLCLSDNVIGTGDGSGKYAATSVQDSSTINRIEYIVNVPYMTEDEEFVVLSNKYPRLDKGIIRRTIKFFGLVRTSFEQGRVNFSLSMRNGFAFLNLLSGGVEPQRAIRLALTNRASEDDLALIKEHLNTSF